MITVSCSTWWSGCRGRTSRFEISKTTDVTHALCRCPVSLWALLLRRSPPSFPSLVFGMCTPRGAPRIAGTPGEDRLDSLVSPSFPLPVLPWETTRSIPLLSGLLLLEFLLGKCLGKKCCFTNVDAVMWPELWGGQF